MELYKQYRPTDFSEIVGQAAAVDSLRRMVKAKNVPHAIMFSGPSGCGKTTLARILRIRLHCHDNDFAEWNSADFRGIEMIRDLRNHVNLCPSGGECRVWLLDEAHQLSRDAQQAFLKILEDTPSQAYFFLATTEPQKLLPTIRTRCTEIALRHLTSSELLGLCQRTVAEIKQTISEEVLEKLVECSDGSARKAMVLLNQIVQMKDEESQIELLEQPTAASQAISLARLLHNPRATWPEVAKLLRTISEEPETIRYLVLSYANNVILGGGKLTGKAYEVIKCFQYNFYDSKKAGLTLACYEVVAIKD